MTPLASAKPFARLLLSVMRADSAARARNRDAVMILMYHGVTPGSARPDRGDRVSASDLEWQIDLLRRRYDLRPLREWIDGRKPDGKPGAAVTFDDGLRSVRAIAMPILERHRCPATVFICPGLIDQRKAPWFEELYGILSAATPSMREGRSVGDLYESIGEEMKALPTSDRETRLHSLRAGYRVERIAESEDRALLDWDDVAAMAGSGLFDFGAHTMTHPNLNRLPRPIQEAEIVGSRDAIRSRVGECAFFAWPNGLADDISPESLEIVRATEFAASFTAMPGWARLESERFLVPRMGLGPSMSRRHFAQRIAGIVGKGERAI
jgi:peptidoglycan/xylan/chitin deacetylase (PgdA/CDA1 family)